MTTKSQLGLKIQAKARIQLTIEISANSPWGADCLIGQLYDQARREAVENLTALLKPEAIASVVIIGEPKVIGIITESAL